MPKSQSQILWITKVPAKRASTINTAGEDSGDHLPRQGAKRRSPESSPVAWIKTDSNPNILQLTTSR